MYLLKRRGFAVTAGVLGAGDEDRSAADKLDIKYVPIPAFGQIDSEAYSQHIALVGAADFVVLCDMPIGFNNLRNLEAVACAAQLICVEGMPITERDHTRGAGSAVYEKLNPRTRCQTVNEAVEAIKRQISPTSSESNPSSRFLVHYTEI